MVRVRRMVEHVFCLRLLGIIDFGQSCPIMLKGQTNDQSIAKSKSAKKEVETIRY